MTSTFALSGTSEDPRLYARSSESRGVSSNVKNLVYTFLHVNAGVVKSGLIEEAFDVV